MTENQYESTHEKRAYYQGYAAHEDGFDHLSNPYKAIPPNSLESRMNAAWIRGWSRARHDGIYGDGAQ